MANAFDGVAPEAVGALKYEILDYVKEKLGDVCADIKNSGKLSKEERALIAETAKEYSAEHKNV